MKEQQRLRIALAHNDVGRCEAEMIDIIAIQIGQRVDKRLDEVLHELLLSNNGRIVFQRVLQRLELAILYRHADKSGAVSRHLEMQLVVACYGRNPGTLRLEGLAEAQAISQVVS